MPICAPSGLQTSVPGELQDEDPGAAAAAGAEPAPPVAGAGAAAGAEPDELDDEVLPGATAGAEAPLEAADATGGATAGALLGAGAAETELAPAAKTPPELEGCGAEAPDVLPDEPEPAAAAPHLGPVGGSFLADCSRFADPGFGKARSPPSCVVQSVAGMLATNMSGNEVSRSVISCSSLFFEPPVTVTGAQFMYISRLPILLNHVHARV